MEEEKIECTGKGVFSLIMGVIGLVLNMWMNGWKITPSILLGGLFSDGAGNNSGIFSSNFSIWISNVLFIVLEK